MPSKKRTDRLCRTCGKVMIGMPNQARHHTECSPYLSKGERFSDRKCAYCPTVMRVNRRQHRKTCCDRCFLHRKGAVPPRATAATDGSLPGERAQQYDTGDYVPVEYAVRRIGKRCGNCLDLPHRRLPPYCVGCGEPYADDRVEMPLPSVASSAGLLLGD